MSSSQSALTVTVQQLLTAVYRASIDLDAAPRRSGPVGSAQRDDIHEHLALWPKAQTADQFELGGPYMKDSLALLQRLSQLVEQGLLIRQRPRPHGVYYLVSQEGFRFLGGLTDPVVLPDAPGYTAWRTSIEVTPERFAATRAHARVAARELARLAYAGDAEQIESALDRANDAATALIHAVRAQVVPPPPNQTEFNWPKILASGEPLQDGQQALD